MCSIEAVEGCGEKSRLTLVCQIGADSRVHNIEGIDYQSCEKGAD